MKKVIVIMTVLLVVLSCFTIPMSASALTGDDVLTTVQTVIPSATGEFIVWLLLLLTTVGVEFANLEEFNTMFADSSFAQMVTELYAQYAVLYQVGGSAVQFIEDSARITTTENMWGLLRYIVTGNMPTGGINEGNLNDGLLDGSIQLVSTSIGKLPVFEMYGNTAVISFNVSLYNQYVVQDSKYVIYSGGLSTWNFLGDVIELKDDGSSFAYYLNSVRVVGYVKSPGRYSLIPYLSYKSLNGEEDNNGDRWTVNVKLAYWNGSKYVLSGNYPNVGIYLSDYDLSVMANPSIVGELFNKYLDEKMLTNEDINIMAEASMIQDLMDCINGVGIGITDVVVPKVTSVSVSTTNDYVLDVVGDMALPTTGEINLPKLPDLELPSIVLKDKFPFCIPFDLAHAFTMLQADPVAPEWNLPIKIQRLGIDESIHLDLDEFEPIVNIMRWLILLAFTVSLVVVTRKLIKG